MTKTGTEVTIPDARINPVEALEKYGRHWDICISHRVPTGCDCGYNRTIAALASVDAPAPVEPVAWMIMAPAGFVRALSANATPEDFEIWHADGDVVIPLYTVPVVKPHD